MLGASVGTTWRGEGADDEPTESGWLERDPRPGEPTPFGTPPARKASLRGVLRRLLGRAG